MLGLKQHVVRLAPYQPAWAQSFAQEKARIVDCIGDFILEVQHVGSTAIPGMPAKPVLDIAIAVDEYERSCCCISPLMGLGYVYRGEHGIPRRHYFVLGEPRTHHLHMLEVSSAAWLGMIRFRDLLRMDSGLAGEYADLKVCLAMKHPNQRDCYQNGKQEFILRVLQASAWVDVAELPAPDPV